MKTASQMREVADNHEKFTKAINTVERSIVDKAQAGRYSLEIHKTELEDGIKSRIVAYLQDNGYLVYENGYCDIVVSWAK